VRQEAAVREAEQRQLAEHVIQSVQQKLTDPAVQNQILAENLSSLNSLSAK
jgi:hypothetical protein